MSKRHQISRRRSYGRRQHEIHELHERLDRLVAAMDWLDQAAADRTTYIWDRHRPSAVLSAQGIE